MRTGLLKRYNYNSMYFISHNNKIWYNNQTTFLHIPEKSGPVCGILRNYMSIFVLFADFMWVVIYLVQVAE